MAKPRNGVRVSLGGLAFNIVSDLGNIVSSLGKSGAGQAFTAVLSLF